MRKFLIAGAAAVAWGVTLFLYRLPGMGIAHASEEEVFPFVIGIGFLAAGLSFAAFRAFVDATNEPHGQGSAQQGLPPRPGDDGGGPPAGQS